MRQQIFFQKTRIRKLFMLLADTAINSFMRTQFNDVRQTFSMRGVRHE